MKSHEFKSPSPEEIEAVLRHANALRANETRRLFRALVAWAGKPRFAPDPDLKPSR